ncbi:glycosyl hydrolase 2 galactose-binding domain-containing protein [Nonomuraea rhizosphaerae]|uniref:glycosyl hydrolase 2 galactose-binding domain-containing protein n=1 Tax=Nonomuraea rhizosphaerae TaxID=2665663 RepID=UPI001C5CE3E9|nr:hypothetical protein [Nonomuraea rhizosphaerae]
MTSVSILGEGWRLRGYLGDDWQLHRAQLHRRDGRDDLGWIPARVPGSVLADLLAAGEVPDPYVGRQSMLSEWVPQRTWVYRTRLHTAGLAGGLTGGFTGEGRAFLEFDGIDGPDGRRDGPGGGHRPCPAPGRHGDHRGALHDHPRPPSGRGRDPLRRAGRAAVLPGPLTPHRIRNDDKSVSAHCRRRLPRPPHPPARPATHAGWARWDDNAIDLLPGEERTLRVHWDGVPERDQRILLDGWNTTGQLPR